MVNRKGPVATEYEEQKALVEWLEWHHLKFSAIPNSTWTPSWKQKARNHATGLRPGLPDILVVIPGRQCITAYVPPRLLFVEMKRRDASPSDVKPDQREWIEALNRVPGVMAVVCYGFDEAEAAIEAELRKP